MMDCYNLLQTSDFKAVFMAKVKSIFFKFLEMWKRDSIKRVFCIFYIFIFSSAVFEKKRRGMVIDVSSSTSAASSSSWCKTFDIFNIPVFTEDVYLNSD